MTEGARTDRILLVIGIVLMLAGAAASAFFVKAMWANDAGTAAAQDSLGAEFAASRATAAASTTTIPIEDDPTIAHTVITTPGEDVPGPEIRTTTSTIPDLVPEASPAPGEALGRILVPAADVDWVLVEGVTLADLAKGPGHMPGTALPGQPGNAVISGHRTTHGAPFARLDHLLPGDTITIETLIGTHVYEVVELRIVAPTDVYVTQQVPGAWLTLTTCHPPSRSIQRLVVFARLVGGPNAPAVAATLTGEEAPPQPPGG